MKAKLVLLAALLVYQVSMWPQAITIKNEVYSSVYDLNLQSPRQVTWTLHAADLGSCSRNPSWLFLPDIPDVRAVARHSDYNKSGYDRGHMCPAADRSFQIDAMRRTFATSNICPQVPSINRGSWKLTEEWCRNAALMYDSVRVLAVPIWLDQDTTFIGPHRLAVPHAFFKAVWVARTDSVINTWFIFNR